MLIWNIDCGVELSVYSQGHPQSDKKQRTVNWFVLCSQPHVIDQESATFTVRRALFGQKNRKRSLELQLLNSLALLKTFLFSDLASIENLCRLRKMTEFRGKSIQPWTWAMMHILVDEILKCIKIIFTVWEWRINWHCKKNCLSSFADL